MCLALKTDGQFLRVTGLLLQSYHFSSKKKKKNGSLKSLLIFSHVTCTTFLENADFVFSSVGANTLLTWLLFATSLWSGRELDERRERSDILEKCGSSPERHPQPRSGPHYSWLGCHF